LPGPAPIKFALNVGFDQANSRRAPLNHSSDTATMRFAEGGDAENLAECAAHYAVILDMAKNLSIKEDENFTTVRVAPGFSLGTRPMDLF
jgi:hypothetical protein